MKIVKWMVLLNALSFQMFAQGEQSWKIYYDSTQHYWAKDWEKSAALLELAEQSAHMDLGIYDENYLMILNDLGTAYWKATKYEEAERHLSQSLSLKMEVFPPGNKKLALSIADLADFYAEQGNIHKSKALYRRILEFDPAYLPSEIYVAAAHDLVSIYDINQQPDSAAYLLRQIEKWNLMSANSYLAYQQQLYWARTHRKLQEFTLAETALNRLLTMLANRTEPALVDLYTQCLSEQSTLQMEIGVSGRAEHK